MSSIHNRPGLSTSPVRKYLAGMPASDESIRLPSDAPDISKALHTLEIQTVEQFIKLDRATIRKRWGVTLERTWQELHGVSCIDFVTQAPARQQIACTRSFGQAVLQLDQLRQAVSHFASQAGVKLREDQSVAGQVLVFIRTSPFRKGPQYSRSAIVPLAHPTDNSQAILQAAHVALGSIYRPGFAYAKAGVILMDLMPNTVNQGELDLGEEPDERIHKPAGVSRLMRAADAINQRFGRGTVQIAALGVKRSAKPWSMRQQLKTPAYTTRLSDIPMVVA